MVRMKAVPRMATQKRLPQLAALVFQHWEKNDRGQLYHGNVSQKQTKKKKVERFRLIGSEHQMLISCLEVSHITTSEGLFYC